MKGYALVKASDEKLVAQKAVSRETAYRQNIRSAVRSLWSGESSFFQFFDQMQLAIERGFTDAWREGAGKCGIQPEELSTEELETLRAMISEELGYIDGFATAIEDGARANQGKLTPLLRRAERWVNRYSGVRDRASSMACSDQKLRWVRHAMDSCTSCLNLEGRVYRASIWNKYDIRPQHPALACVQGAQGVPVCRCQFAVTDDPVTPGRPPGIP